MKITLGERAAKSGYVLSVGFGWFWPGLERGYLRGDSTRAGGPAQRESCGLASSA